MNRYANFKPNAAHAIARVGSRSPWPFDGGIDVLK
jgi:hypothetical protein